MTSSFFIENSKYLIYPYRLHDMREGYSHEGTDRGSNASKEDGRL
jgi:hypothetical protein